MHTLISNSKGFLGWVCSLAIEMTLNFLIIPNHVVGAKARKIIPVSIILISLISSTSLMHEAVGQSSSPLSLGSGHINNIVSLQSIKVPSNKIAEATGPDGAAVTYSASASDTSGNKVSVNCSPPSGSTFSIGSNTVTCGVAGSSETRSFLVTVKDTTHPIVSVPADMTLEATGPGGRVVNYNATASDIVDGNIVPSCSPVSGFEFPLGQTGVKCTATDKAGNIGTNSFIISVRDTTPPETSLENVTVGWLGSIAFGNSTPSNDINFEFNGTDLVGVRNYECRIDGGSWQLGKTVLDISNNRINICTYTDLLNQGAHNFQVRAVDTSGNKDPNPPNFMWEIESPLNGVQELKLQVENTNPQINLESSLNQVIKTLSDKSTANDAMSCYLLSSFMNEIKLKNLQRMLGYTDFDKMARTTLAIMDNVGCPPPIAKAGLPQTVDAGTNGVILDGGGSLYADNQAKFNWKQIGEGPTIKIKKPDLAKASFDAPPSSQFSDNNNLILTFQLAVTGIGGLESTDTTTVQVNLPNTPPVANSQSVTTTKDTSASITLDASDKDGDTLTYSIKSFPAHGSLSSFDKDTGAVIYNPNRGYTGSDSFTFTASDGTSTSNTAKVSITINSVTPINTPPVVKDQNVTTPINTPVNITLRGTDANGDTLRSFINSHPSNGTLGEINQTTHTLTYTPSPNFTGLDSFTHKANDGKEDSNIGKVTINVRKK